MGLFFGLAGSALSGAFSQPIGLSGNSNQTSNQTQKNTTSSSSSASLSDTQKKTLESFRKIIKKIREENGNSVDVFRNEEQLYEACAGLEDQSFRCGRDLLLTIFMKQIPQVFANIYIANNRVYWDAETEEILTDELGMKREFALLVLEILKEEFEK